MGRSSSVSFVSRYLGTKAYCALWVIRGLDMLFQVVTSHKEKHQLHVLIRSSTYSSADNDENNAGQLYHHMF